MEEEYDVDELAALSELSQPKAGDDEQMVVIRTLLRAVVRLSRTTASHGRRIKEATTSAAACAEASREVVALKTELSPTGNPDAHIAVRVARLERTSEGVAGLLKANAGSIILALILGAYQLIIHVGK